MKKWLTGIAATVISGIIIFWLTDGTRDIEVKPREHAVTFPITYEKSPDTIEGQVVVYIADASEARLSVDQSRPFHTVNITVPKHGSYAYRLELQEFALLLSAKDLRTRVPVTRHMSGQGKIQVESGDAFMLIKRVDPGAVSGSEWSVALRKVLSDEERRKADEEFREFWEKLVDSQ